MLEICLDCPVWYSCNKAADAGANIQPLSSECTQFQQAESLLNTASTPNPRTNFNTYTGQHSPLF